MPKINEMFAFITSDTDENDEGIVSIPMDGIQMPLIGADLTRVDALMSYAQHISNVSNKQIVIKRFMFVEVLDTIMPF